MPCDNVVMAHFLDGLIIHRRGRDESAPPRPVEKTITNNTVLKKLRVAFELKEEDCLALMAATGFQVSKPELSALFRNPAHHNFRPCGDQFLRNFLKGLTERVRGASLNAGSGAWPLLSRAPFSDGVGGGVDGLCRNVDLGDEAGPL